jgi:hypothetical protein
MGEDTKAVRWKHPFILMKENKTTNDGSGGKTMSIAKEDGLKDVNLSNSPS